MPQTDREKAMFANLGKHGGVMKNRPVQIREVDFSELKVIEIPRDGKRGLDKHESKIKTLPERDDDIYGLHGYHDAHNHHIGIDENLKDNTHFIHGQSEGNEDQWYEVYSRKSVKDKDYLDTKQILSLPDKTLLVGRDGLITTKYALLDFLPMGDEPELSPDPLGGWYKQYHGKLSYGDTDKKVADFERVKHKLPISHLD